MKKTNQVIVVVSLLTLAACGNIPSDINVNGKLDVPNTASDKTPKDDKDNNSKKPDKTEAKAEEEKTPELLALDGNYIATHSQCGAKTTNSKKPVKLLISASTIIYYNQVSLCGNDYLKTAQEYIGYDGKTLTLIRQYVFAYPDKSNCGGNNSVDHDASSVESTYYTGPMMYNYSFDGTTLAIEGNTCDNNGNKSISYYIKE